MTVRFASIGHAPIQQGNEACGRDARKRCKGINDSITHFTQLSPL